MKLDAKFYQNLFQLLQTNKVDEKTCDALQNHPVMDMGYLGRKGPKDTVQRLIKVHDQLGEKKSRRKDDLYRRFQALIKNKKTHDATLKKLTQRFPQISHNIAKDYRSLGFDINVLKHVIVHATAGCFSNAKTSGRHILLDLSFHKVDSSLKILVSNLYHECFHVIHSHNLLFPAFTGELYTTILSFTYTEGLASFFAARLTGQRRNLAAKGIEKTVAFYARILKQSVGKSLKDTHREWAYEKLYYSTGKAYQVGEFMAWTIYEKLGMPVLCRTAKEGHLSFFKAFTKTGHPLARKWKAVVDLPEVRLL